MQENENSFSENAVQEEVLINQLIEECKKIKRIIKINIRHFKMDL